MDSNLIKIRHERSKKDYPGLKLDEDEYVEYAFSRAKICLWMILGSLVAGLIVILLAFLFVLMSQAKIDEMGKNFLFIILFALLAAAIIIGIIAVRVFNGNKIYVTNKHIIQYVMDSIVSSSVNVIDLSMVEDASFKQENILQQMFHYGTFRLSTVGDETTYTFKYSDISQSDLRGVTEILTAARKVKIDKKHHKSEQ